MIRTVELNVTELKEYMKLLKLEQTFRVKLHRYREDAELQLKRITDLKELAKVLDAHKKKLRKIKIDKDVEKDIRKVINRSFKGGVI